METEGDKESACEQPREGITGPAGAKALGYVGPVCVL